MRIRCIHIIFFLIVSIGMEAQDTTALDHFNRASREYVKQDKLTALRTLDRGLRQFPGDPRMLKLAEELLKEEQQQQQQDQQKQDQEKNNEEKKQDQQQKDQGEENKPDQKDGGEQSDQQPKDEPQEPQQRDGQQQPRKPGSIAPQDARRMLDALDREEKEVQDKVRIRQRPASRIPIEKDW